MIFHLGRIRLIVGDYATVRRDHGDPAFNGRSKLPDLRIQGIEPLGAEIVGDELRYQPRVVAQRLLSASNLAALQTVCSD